MVIIINTQLLSLTLTFGFAVIVLAYSGYADAHGWPAGEMFRSNTSFLKVFAAIAVPAAPIAALFVLPWWNTFIVVIGGSVFGLLATRILRSSVQLLTVIALPVCWAVDIVMLSQS